MPSGSISIQPILRTAEIRALKIIIGHTVHYQKVRQMHRPKQQAAASPLQLHQHQHQDDRMISTC